MKEKQLQKRPPMVLKRFIIIFLPLLAVLSGIPVTFYYFEIENRKVEEQIFETNEANNINQLVNTISNDIKMVVSDFMVLSGHHDLQQMLQSGKAYHREALAEEFLVFIENKKFYDKIRLLDENGMEIIRVNSNAGKPYIVPDDQLQFKGEHYYFEDTIQLGRGEMFMSPFDLNMENGKIEMPIKPIIRFGMPVFDVRGQKRGILVLNYFGEILIDKLKKASINARGQIVILNSNGYWLHGASPENKWGFMYEDKKDLTFGKTSPEEWQRISMAESGHFHNLNGLFTFTTVYPLLECWDAIAESNVIRKNNFNPSKIKEYQWKIVSQIPPAFFRTGLRKFLVILFSISGFMILLTGVGSWFLASAGVRRKVAEEALRESMTRYRQVHATSFDGIIIANANGKIIEANLKAEQTFGYGLGGLVDLDLINIIPKHFRERHRNGIKRFLDTGESKMQGSIISIEGLSKNGDIFPIELTVNSFEVNGEIYFTGTVRNITERKQAEEKLKKSYQELEATQKAGLNIMEDLDRQKSELDLSLKEKEMLLREIHHRVKNNMQIISSLLRLQSKNIKDEQYITMLKESQYRIKAISLIHEKLYQSEDLANIKFKDYIYSLARDLFRSYKINTRKIALKLNIDTLTLGIDIAIPCGLIVNELISNSLKYAFPLDESGERTLDTSRDRADGKEGEINIFMQKIADNGPEMVELIVSDNGVGIPEEIDFRNSKSLGLRLITNLVEHQLHGKIELNRSNGTEFNIRFKEVKYKKRL